MLKQFTTTLLALAMCLSCLGLAWAVSEEEKEAPEATPAPAESAAPEESPAPTDSPAPLTRLEQAAVCADELNQLGLFKGTNQGYDLESTATRAQAVTMLLRLMGLDVYAQAMPTPHPFTDLPRWCSSAVGYAYRSGLTNGTNAANTTFSPNVEINARAYLTFLLRALGYSADDGLTWQNTYDFSVQHGLIEAGAYTDDSEFLRADLVLLSRHALDLIPKGGSATLLEQLQARPAFPVLDNGFVNTAGTPDGYQGGTGRFPGQLAVPSQGGPQRPAWDGTETLEELMEELNGYASYLYGGHRFTPEGIVNEGQDRGQVMNFVTDDAGRMGVRIFHWRQGYGSTQDVDYMLNMTLEALLYLSGDGEAAYALWSWIDAANIRPEGADTAAFGFTDVEATEHGGVIRLNDTELEVDLSNPSAHIYWFDSPAAQPEETPKSSAKPE